MPPFIRNDVEIARKGCSMGKKLPASQKPLNPYQRAAELRKLRREANHRQQLEKSKKSGFSANAAAIAAKGAAKAPVVSKKKPAKPRQPTKQEPEPERNDTVVYEEMPMLLSNSETKELKVLPLTPEMLKTKSPPVLDGTSREQDVVVQCVWETFNGRKLSMGEVALLKDLKMQELYVKTVEHVNSQAPSAARPAGSGPAGKPGAVCAYTPTLEPGKSA